MREEDTAVDTDSPRERSAFETLSEAALIYLPNVEEGNDVDSYPQNEPEVFKALSGAVLIYLPCSGEP